MAAAAAVVQWLLVLALLVGHSQGQSEASITGLVDNSTLTELGRFTTSSVTLLLNSGFDEIQFLFTGLRFRCSGNVTKWIIGADFNSTSRTRDPALGIYRDRPGGGFADRIGATVLEQSNFIPTQVYEFTPDPPLPFQTNDSLGIYLPPENQLRLQPLHRLSLVIDGPASQNYVPSNPPAEGVFVFDFTSAPTEETDRLPLVAVEIESDDPDNANCTRDFISRDLLQLLTATISIRSSNSGLQIVFPSSNFTSDGVITSWTVNALWRDGTGRNMFSELQIWRRRSGNTYDKIASTELTATAYSFNQLYSGTIDPPLQFQSGDVLGMYLPPDGGSIGARLLVYFALSGGPTYEITVTEEPLSSITLTGQGTVISNFRPFLALEISPPPVPTTCTLSTVCLSISTAVGSTVGVFIGGVVVGTVTVLIIAAAVARARNKNQKDGSVPAIDLTATTAERMYDYPLQHETTAVCTKHNEAYATAVSTAPNEAYATAVSTAPNQAYATAVSTAPNEAYATARGGDTIAAEYNNI